MTKKHERHQSTCSSEESMEVVPQSAFGFRNSLTEDFVTLAESFESTVRVEWTPRETEKKTSANGKDPLALSALKSRREAPIKIHAIGTDASHAVKQLAELVENRPGARFWTIMRDVVILNRLGIHSRPAAKLVTTAMKYDSQIIIECLGKSGNCKYITNILTLNARQGSRVTFRAIGCDAGQAIEALSDLVNSKFGEA